MNTLDLPLAAPAVIKRAKVLRLSHDFETYCDISVTDVGADAYSRDPSCEVLMCGYAIETSLEDGPVAQWVPEEGELMPTALEDALRDERVVKTCWNKDFEYAIWKNVVGITIPHAEWRDTQALAYSLSLPGSLEKAGEAIEIAEDRKKAAAGRLLIRLFSMPRKPSKFKPWTRTRWWREREKWEQYKDYNRQDVRAERAILRKLLKFDMPAHEWELWVIDQIINERGIPMNMRAVDAAIRLYEYLIESRMDRLREITQLDNPNSNAKLLLWLRDKGYPFEDMQKGHIRRAHEAAKETPDFADPDYMEALRLRKDTSRASPKKYYAIRRCVDRAEGVLRNTMQFAGAGRTWRWAGRIFQPHNLPRPEKFFKKIMAEVVVHLERLDPEGIDLVFNNPMDLLVSVIRSMAQAPDGYMLYDADLNAIENRNLGWITRCGKIMKVFEDGRDPYVDFATYMYHQPYDVLYAEYKNGDDSKRQISKPAVLGCGYQLGPGSEYVNDRTGEIEATGLIGYARNMYVDMDKAQAEYAVKVFRETFTEVVDGWYEMGKAANKCVRTGKPTSYNMVGFDIAAPFLRMNLPSGHALYYCRPRIEPTMTPWGEMRDQLTYEGLNDKNQWVRNSTHGGKLVENADQAIARDVLAHGMRLAHDRGLDLRLHVHDQMIGIAKIDVAQKHLDVLQECMTDVPKWATYKGMTLPLASNGFVSKVFMKD